MRRSDSTIRLSSFTGADPISTHVNYAFREIRALTPPGYYKEWHVGVRVSSNKKLVAFISGVPLVLRVRAK